MIFPSMTSGSEKTERKQSVENRASLGILSTHCCCYEGRIEMAHCTNAFKLLFI